MLKRIFVLASFILILALPMESMALGPMEPSHSAPSWMVSYWNNTTLSGEPVASGSDAQIYWDWGSGSPRSNVNADRFSVRWSRYVDLVEGTYRFTGTSDDGIRVLVDGRLIINQWDDHPPRTFTSDVHLPAGHHLITVEYYEKTGIAVAKLSWAPLPKEPRGWFGEYFGGTSLNGVAIIAREDAGIDFNWGYGSPSSMVPSDGFSVRWTRTIEFQPGLYRFTTSTDDGVRLWVNGHLLIDRWMDQPFRSHSGVIHLSGFVPIRMEYYENGGIAAAKLSWAPADEAPPPAGQVVVVDDADAGFVRGGSPTAWRTAGVGVGGQMTWTRNNDWGRPQYNWARWYPNLEPGRYEVSVYVPFEFATTARATYWVSHRGGSSHRVVDQSRLGGQWVSLGTYEFAEGRGDYVSLTDITYESYLSRLIAFDAMRWTAR